jgi:hypothetical protein
MEGPGDAWFSIAEILAIVKQDRDGPPGKIVILGDCGGREEDGGWFFSLTSPG